MGDNDYIPYGKEWVKEMKKLPKEFLIGMIKDLNISRKEAAVPLPTNETGLSVVHINMIKDGDYTLDNGLGTATVYSDNVIDEKESNSKDGL